MKPAVDKASAVTKPIVVNQQLLGVVTMLTDRKNKNPDTHTALRRMREASGLTMRQTAALVGLSHVAISQFENKKLNLPDSRVDALVRTYGYTQTDFEKILGRKPVGSPKDDCRAMLDRLNDDQLLAIRNVIAQLVARQPSDLRVQVKLEEGGQ